MDDDKFLPHTQIVCMEVFAERHRQDQKWGEQNHPDGTRGDARLLRASTLPTYGILAYLSKNLVDASAKDGTTTYAEILLEEVFEALAEHDPHEVRKELIQVAAVAVAWVEAIDRRRTGVTS